MIYATFIAHQIFICSTSHKTPRYAKKETPFKYDNTKVRAILQTFAISIMPHKIADISILRANIVA